MGTFILVVMKTVVEEEQLLSLVPCIDNGDYWLVPDDCWDLLMVNNIPYQKVHLDVRID